MNTASFQTFISEVVQTPTAISAQNAFVDELFRSSTAWRFEQPVSAE